MDILSVCPNGVTSSRGWVPLRACQGSLTADPGTREVTALPRRFHPRDRYDSHSQAGPGAGSRAVPSVLTALRPAAGPLHYRTVRRPAFRCRACRCVRGSDPRLGALRFDNGPDLRLVGCPVGAGGFEPPASCSQTRSDAVCLPAERLVPAAQGRHHKPHGYGLVRSSSVASATSVLPRGTLADREMTASALKRVDSVLEPSSVGARRDVEVLSALLIRQRPGHVRASDIEQIVDVERPDPRAVVRP